MTNRNLQTVSFGNGTTANVGAETLKSTVCRCEHFTQPWYTKWTGMVSDDDPKLPLEQRVLHRKPWEYCAITAALYERGMLALGKLGIGFAVGREPLVSLFAALGATVLATDTGSTEISEIWKTHGEYAGDKNDLFRPNLIDRHSFDQRVQFRHADMRDLSQFQEDSFDFVWSSCALEHLGSLQAGAKFVLESARLLKKGGVAVHTTEYNVSSDDETVVDGITVIYRRRDLRKLACDLGEAGYKMEPFDFDIGNHRYDLEPETPPYAGVKHIKLQLGGFVVTSILLIIRG